MFRFLLIISSFLLLSSSVYAQTQTEDISNPAQSIANFDESITIKDINIVGNQLVPTKVILENMQTKKGSKFSRRTITYDLKNLDNLGYFEKDKLIAVPISKGEDGVVLQIQVVENSPVTGLIIKGNKSIDKENLEEFLTPLVGMPRSTTQIRNAIEKIESVYHDKGYLLASVTELHFDADGYLTVDIDEGYLSNIEFEGNAKTKTEYLEKILPKKIAGGQVYNEQEVGSFLEALNRSGFFKEVKREIKPSKEDPSKHVLTFKVEEQRTKSMSVGTGLGTMDGFFGNLTFTEPNFRGQGETISFSGVAGTGMLTALDGNDDGRYARQGDFRFEGNYIDPFFLNKDIGFTSNVYARRNGSYLIDSAMQRSIGSGISFSKRLKNHKNWSMQGGLALSNTDVSNWGDDAKNTLEDALRDKEHYSESGASKEAKSIRDRQLTSGTYLDFTPSLIYKNIDEQGNGWRNSFFAGPSLGLGAGSYGSIGMDVKRYDRLTDKGTFFKNAFRAEGLGGDPAYFRMLKAGGPYGARGYQQFLDVGVGNALLSNTMELAIPLPQLPKGPIKETKLVFFNDLAAVFGEKRVNDLYDRESFIASIGLGFEVTVPMLGPLRVDYGIPLLRPDNKSFWSGRIHINAGSQL